jgi:cytosine/adenosine deaminase-related metal-dependent hydrolase
MVAGIAGLIPSLKRNAKVAPGISMVNFVYGSETEWILSRITCGSEMSACPLANAFLSSL